ncbi:MAG: response regulator transcription factor [Rikenellaceae bacterium]|nr:response regulator transcription factor [Rikenellaceae bacterium]
MHSRTKYNVLIITPSDIMAAGVSEILLRSREFVPCGTIPNLDFYSESKFKDCDLVLVDPIVASWEGRGELRRQLSGSGVPVLALSCSTMSDEWLTRNFDGVIGLYDGSETIISRLNAVMEQTQNATSTRIESDELSARERDILTAVARGKTNKEIADDFNLSVHTVITHRKNISHKLGINSISGLTVYAILNKLIDVTDY